MYIKNMKTESDFSLHKAPTSMKPNRPPWTSSNPTSNHQVTSMSFSSMWLSSTIFRRTTYDTLNFRQAIHPKQEIQFIPFTVWLLQAPWNQIYCSGHPQLHPQLIYSCPFLGFLRLSGIYTKIFNQTRPFKQAWSFNRIWFCNWFRSYNQIRSFKQTRSPNLTRFSDQSRSSNQSSSSNWTKFSN